MGNTTDESPKKISTSRRPATSPHHYRLECEEALKSLPPDRSSLSMGVAGGPSCEIIPVLVPMDSDSLFPKIPKTNAQIVCGKDRPASRVSGKGSDTGAAAIDLVVGRMGADPQEDAKVDPNFTKDSARIYISQKSDVDVNFGLMAGGVGISNDKSAIALKADGVRIIAREGIKLVTGTDTKNSQGGEVRSILGVDIIAGNRDEDLEPMVKGAKLVGGLAKLADLQGTLNGIVKHLLTVQMQFNSAVQNHFHHSPWFGNPTQMSDACQAKGAKASMDHLQETQRSLTTHRTNLTNWKQNNLCESGRDFVLSRWNKLN